MMQYRYYTIGTFTRVATFINEIINLVGILQSKFQIVDTYKALKIQWPNLLWAIRKVNLLDKVKAKV